MRLISLKGSALDTGNLARNALACAFSSFARESLWLTLKKWRFELSDHVYWGGRQFSDYAKHGNQLFRGDPYYRSRFYNRTNLTFYLLNKSYIQCRVTASVHYTEHEVDNSQQIILHIFPNKDLLGRLFKR